MTQLSDLSLIKMTPGRNSGWWMKKLCVLVTSFGFGLTIILVGYLLELGTQLAR